MRESAGFTLVEWVVAMAVLSLLVGAVTPGFVARVAHARLRAAQSDVIAIGKAVDSFYKDLEVWPARNVAGQNNSVAILFSGPSVPTSNPYLGGGFWSLVSGGADTIDNQLFLNRPQGASAGAYATNAFTAWHGPYTEAVGLDPWGRPYLVNVVAGSASDATNNRRLWVLSAGPDGILQTNALARLQDAASGDDVGYLVYLR